MANPDHCHKADWAIHLQPLEAANLLNECMERVAQKSVPPLRLCSRSKPWWNDNLTKAFRVGMPWFSLVWFRSSFFVNLNQTVSQTKPNHESVRPQFSSGLNWFKPVFFGWGGCSSHVITNYLIWEWSSLQKILKWVLALAEGPHNPAPFSLPSSVPSVPTYLPLGFEPHPGAPIIDGSDHLCLCVLLLKTPSRMAQKMLGWKGCLVRSSWV